MRDLHVLLRDCAVVLKSNVMILQILTTIHTHPSEKLRYFGCLVIHYILRSREQPILVRVYTCRCNERGVQRLLYTTGGLFPRKMRSLWMTTHIR